MSDTLKASFTSQWVAVNAHDPEQIERLPSDIAKLITDIRAIEILSATLQGSTMMRLYGNAFLKNPSTVLLEAFMATDISHMKRIYFKLIHICAEDFEFRAKLEVLNFMYVYYKRGGSIMEYTEFYKVDCFKAITRVTKKFNDLQASLFIGLIHIDANQPDEIFCDLVDYYARATVPVQIALASKIVFVTKLQLARSHPRTVEHLFLNIISAHLNPVIQDNNLRDMHSRSQVKMLLKLEMEFKGSALWSLLMNNPFTYFNVNFGITQSSNWVAKKLLQMARDCNALWAQQFIRDFSIHDELTMVLKTDEFVKVSYCTLTSFL